MSGFGRGGPRGGRGGGSRFQRSDPSAPRMASEVQIFVENLPLDAKIPALVEFFSAAGRVKVDRLTKTPRVWLYHDKTTGQPTGECTVTYCDHDSQLTALKMFNGHSYMGLTLTVTPSIVKPHMARLPPPSRGRGRGGGGGKMMGTPGTGANRGALGTRGFRSGDSSGRGFGRSDSYGSFGSRGDDNSFNQTARGFGRADSYEQSHQYGESSYGQPGTSLEMYGGGYYDQSGYQGQSQGYGASRYAPY